jgi:hypothetical protein
MNKSRASSSLLASKYKLKGHQDEVEFSKFIDGEIVPGVGKTDFIDNKKNKYSIKGGKKKWQIFLYGTKRFESDPGFEFSNIGKMFKNSLNCFPDDYVIYKQDKDLAKEQLKEFFDQNQRKPHDVEEYLSILGEQNSYLNAKINLEKNNKIIKNCFLDQSILHQFLMKSIFNNEEVDFWVIKNGQNFQIYRSIEAVNALVSELQPALSSLKQGRSDDINFPGQKVLLRSKTNVIELEVRNDSVKHYKQIRFNMIREKTLLILDKHFKQHYKINEKLIFFQMIESN